MDLLCHTIPLIQDVDLVWSETLKYPNEVDEDSLANSKLKFMQKIDCENLEHIEAKLSQGHRKGILDVLEVRWVYQSAVANPYLSRNQGFILE